MSFESVVRCPKNYSMFNKSCSRKKETFLLLNLEREMPHDTNSAKKNTEISEHVFSSTKKPHIELIRISRIVISALENNKRPLSLILFAPLCRIDKMKSSICNRCCVQSGHHSRLRLLSRNQPSLMSRVHKTEIS